MSTVIDFIFYAVIVVINILAIYAIAKIRQRKTEDGPENVLGHLQPDTYWKCILPILYGKEVLLMGPCAVPDGDKPGLYVEIQDIETKRLGYIGADDFLYAYRRLTPIDKDSIGAITIDHDSIV